MLIEQVIKQHELLETLSQGGTVLTGNNRLANTLIEKYDRYNLDNNKTAWSSPDIIPLNSWLIQQWEAAVVSGVISADTVLLSNEQELQLWESIIKNSQHGNGLLRISATAKSVSDAWRLLQNWNLSRDKTEYQTSDDSKAFDYWCCEFENHCKQQHWIVTAQLASLEFYSDINENNKIILLGFDELTPQLQCLIEKLKTTTEEITWCRLDNKGRNVVRLECDDLRDEINSFALWSKQLLEDNPGISIALIASDINSIRTILIQTLERILLPSNSALSIINQSDQKNSNYSNNEKLAKPWDISLGISLSEYSIIKLAFQLLDIVRGKIPIEVISSLLRSPHIMGATEEMNQRALLDRHCREQGEPLISLRTLQFYSSQESKSYNSPIFNGLISELIELKKSCLVKADSEQWTSWLTNWLTKAGWGSGRTLSSNEYQTVEAWKSLLQSFNSLNIVTQKMTLEEALSCLHRLASDKIFQVQSQSSPIKILGLYESIGLDFDYLWVMNLNDEVWPVSPRPNPFIPLHIQKKFSLPHASWERELVIAKQITNRLKESAPDVVFSYPNKNGIQDCRFSPLIKNYSQTTKQDLLIEEGLSWKKIITNHSELKVIENDTVVAVGNENVSGGSTIFKNQSLCPFRALIENRLHAKPMRKTQPGLDAMKRGSLLHSVLEKFWRIITDQLQLKSKTTQEIETIINNCIDNSIEEMVVKSPDTFSDSFTRIEKQRLHHLMLYWLDLELQRAPFKVIETEREITIHISGVNAHLFIDRVDELENGRQMVIDYKTGLVSPTDWFGERPNDPQLPLYSIASGNNLSAVLFAQIKTGDVKFNGVVEEQGLIPNLPPTRKGLLKETTEQWPKVLTNWNTVLNSLATDFVQSHIDVDPKEGEMTCRKIYCELSPLCRINELLENNGLNSYGNSK